MSLIAWLEKMQLKKIFPSGISRKIPEEKNVKKYCRQETQRVMQRKCFSAFKATSFHFNNFQWHDFCCFDHESEFKEMMSCTEASQIYLNNESCSPINTCHHRSLSHNFSTTDRSSFFTKQQPKSLKIKVNLNIKKKWISRRSKNKQNKIMSEAIIEKMELKAARLDSHKKNF